MKAWRSRPESREPSDASEFVPRKEFDRAQRQIEQQQEKIERFQHEAERSKQEIERLRRECGPACRLLARSAASRSRRSRPISCFQLSASGLHPSVFPARLSLRRVARA